MMEKQELLNILKEALDAEEKGVLIYKRHLESAIFWTGISKNKIQRAKELLEDLAQGSAGHKKAVERLIKETKEKDKDAI